MPGLHQALSMCVYGPSKVGKSLMGASTPPPRVILDVESAARFLPLKAITWDPAGPPPPVPGNDEWDTAVVPVRRWPDALAVLDWLKQGDHPFRSATVDSISELQYRYIEHATGREQMKIQDWGAALRELGGFVRDLRDLTMHPTNPLTAVVLTAMAQENPQSGQMRPYLQGQLKTQLPYLPDVTAYLHVEPDVSGVETRYLETRRNAQWEAGERVGGRIPATLVLPQVTGDTEDEIRARNTTFAKIIKTVYKNRGIAAPAKTPATTTAPAQTPAVPADATDTQEN
jgi:hypothetical protein